MFKFEHLQNCLLSQFHPEDCAEIGVGPEYNKKMFGVKKPITQIWNATLAILYALLKWSQTAAWQFPVYQILATAVKKENVCNISDAVHICFEHTLCLSIYLHPC